MSKGKEKGRAGRTALPPEKGRRFDNANQVAHALGLHMVGAGWVTTADKRLSKAHIIKAVEEAKGEDTANLLTGLKKEGSFAKPNGCWQGLAGCLNRCAP